MKPATEPRQMFAFVGNWDRYHPGSSGIGIFQFNEQSGELTPLGSVAPEVIIDVACVDQKRGVLYCTDQHFTRPRGALGGAGLIHAFRIDQKTGGLTEINRQQSFGALPSYVAVDASGDYLIATHHTDRVAVNKVIKDDDGKFRVALEYDDATTVLFRLGADGAIGEPVDVYIHTGEAGPLRQQTHSQVHCVIMSPSGEFFAVCDKGADEIFMFRINRDTETLEVCGGAPFKTMAGSSPRYAAFHPTKPYLFVNHETQHVVSALRYDHDGALSMIAVANSRPDDCRTDVHILQSDLRMHPNGTFLYSLVRGLNAVAVFAVDQDSGALARIQFVTLDSNEPRGCAISPDGRFLVIAALKGQVVSTYAIGDDGKLSPTGYKVSQPFPSNVTFFRGD